jgi:hypothetical protein
MKIEDLEKVYNLNANISTIDSFIKVCRENPKHIIIENGFFGIDIKKEYEHEIINALEKIKSNMVEQLKELGVEV